MQKEWRWNVRALGVLSFLIVLTTLPARGLLQNVDAGQAMAGIRYDVTDHFDVLRASNYAAASASMDERSGNVSLPGIFLHPNSSAEDAVYRLDDITLAPPRAPGRLAADQRTFLLFAMGMRDNIPWDTDSNPPNGVRFSVTVNSEVVFTEVNASPGWKRRAIDLAPWAGQTIAVEFRTNAVDNNSSYDWAVWGWPRLISIRYEPNLDKLESQGTAGVAVVEVSCAEPASGALTLGDDSESLTLTPGTHAFYFDHPLFHTPTLSVASGQAEIEAVFAAAYQPNVAYYPFEFSSPLVIAGEPFSVQRTITNKGLGHWYYKRGRDETLYGAPGEVLHGFGPAGLEPRHVPRLGPGETFVARWDGLVAERPGDFPFTDVPNNNLHVFPHAPVPPEDRGTGGSVSVAPDQSLATVSNPWSRVSIVRETSGDAYGILETWNGKAWQRSGSLYPLFQVKVEDLPAEPRASQSRGIPMRGYLISRVMELREESGSLIVDGTAEKEGFAPWKVRLRLTPDSPEARIRMESSAQPSADCALEAFYGPVVLAGDRAYGARKDFAIFPGLEYLEGDEASSSDRDLAYPLSDRRVPAIYKIAGPLMAVQGQQTLTALLWDPRQGWAKGESHPASRFLSPAYESGIDYTHVSLFAPSVGDYVKQNEYAADGHPYPAQKGQKFRLDAYLVLDHASHFGQNSIVRGPHRGGLVLMAVQHWFDVFGLPEPSTPPRSWDEARALCRAGYFESVWHDDPPGWSHCHGWNPGLYVGHAVPLLIDERAGVTPAVKAEIDDHVGRVIHAALDKHGPQYLWTGAGCHIMLGELPFYVGYLPEAMNEFRQAGFNALQGRENGLWVWRPQAEKYESLGVAGDHTLGQASAPSMRALRAARMTGDPDLTAQALDAMKQMERYEVPRGAQTWECPLYQPDILAAAQAVRAYCEAYRITGDSAYLDQARYWAWTGLPFLYLWELDGYPTMKYNVISVIGSTFYSHSWLGLPVVWCGLVYAYAVQDLAEFDDTFPWKTIAEGITNSTMWQQYSDGPSKGCYPDSWNMVKNSPNPADINPENILVNGWRLRGHSPEIRFARIASETGHVMLNTSADLTRVEGSVREKRLAFSLTSPEGFPAYAMLAPVDLPKSVSGAGEKSLNSAALMSVESGRLYDPNLRALVLKVTGASRAKSVEINW